MAAALAVSCCGTEDGSLASGASNFTLDPDRRREASVRRVLTGLRPGVRFTNRADQAFTLAERLEYYRVPGVSIATVHAGEIVWVRVFGRKHSERPEPLTTESVLHAKSVSKPVAAALTLRLVDRGVLELDAPLEGMLTSWRVPDNRFTRATPPTLRHLLSHSAGFTEHGVDSFLPSEDLPTLLQTIQGDTPEADTVTVDYEPGTDFRYSGGGYGVLQLLLEDVTGRPLSRLADSLVFRPLGMGHSFYPLRFTDTLRPFAAVGHDARGNPAPGGYEILPMQAAGGLWTTARDLARFVIALDEAWAGEPGSILEPSTAREMLRPHADDWGLGVQVETVGGELRFSHGGSGDGFRAVIVGYPERGDGAAILANGDGAGELHNEILRSFAREYGWPGYERETHELVALEPRRLETFTGRYEWASGILETVRLGEEGLETQFGDEGRFRRLFPIGERGFVANDGDVYSFELGTSGEVGGLVLQEEGGSYRATRVP